MDACLAGFFFYALLDYKEMKVPHIKALGWYPVPFLLNLGVHLEKLCY